MTKTDGLFRLLLMYRHKMGADSSGSVGRMEDADNTADEKGCGRFRIHLA